jgi:8-oxo-dGTP pyrophosphatase MutT (NUDIX family)
MSPSERENRSTTYSTQLNHHIHNLLLDLQSHPFPILPSPSTLPRRASVALILRFRPHYSFPSSSISSPSAASSKDKLDAFFSQEWVKHADPEVLFIKRAANKRDKWTGHVAFPGGRRDPEDADDYAAAVRETLEEVGLDLAAYAVPAGNLSQAVITAAWGKTPLMVFCPYVFVVTDPNLPPLRLQPSEVASAHWVPVRSLLDPRWRSYWIQDVSSRTSGTEYGLNKAVLRILTGNMLFAAIRLHPSETVVATESREYAEMSNEWASIPNTNVTVPLLLARKRLTKFEDRGAGLLLWGLTLSVVGDFLDMLPPYDVINQFVYPTFTAPDVRLLLWLLSYNFRKRNVTTAESELKKLSIPTPDPETNLVTVKGEDGRDEIRYFGRIRADLQGRRGKAAFDLLPGYYPIIRKAVVAATLLKLGALGALISILYRKWTS